MNITTTNTVQALTAHWVPVRDASGRERLEMRWSIDSAQPAPLAHAA